MVVYILNCEGTPLMPCSPRTARKLLKESKAKVVRRTPFTLKLIHPCANRIQVVAAGMDTGSKTIGVAAIANGKVLFQGETKLRGEEIKRKMEQRAMYRRTRRSRLRYRKPRFLNRKASTRLDRLPPSVRHKVEAHLRERRFLEKILPVSFWNVETASFDIHAISNPEIKNLAKIQGGEVYQKGEKYGLSYLNAKQFIFSRDKYTCQKCKKKGTDKKPLKLNAHHIIFRSNGGTNTPNNLVTVCESCHKKLHAHKNAEKESLKLQKTVNKNTKHATEVSILRSRLLKSDWRFVETFGYITKFNRQKFGLPKTHANDAIMIASQGEIIDLGSNLQIYKKKLISKGDYQQTKGVRSEKKIPTGKSHGLRKFDLIQTDKGVGFVKGKRSTGYFVIMDVDGNPIHNSVNIKRNCKRITSRGSFIMEAQFLPALKNGVSLREIR